MKKRLPLLISFILFLALSGSVTYWSLEFFKAKGRPVEQEAPRTQPEIALDAAAGLFGGHLVASTATNYQLKGVISAHHGGAGVAILVADGKPAQTLGVGEEVSSGVTVKEVHAQYVLLSDSGALKRVDLPENKSARAEGMIAPAQPDASQLGNHMGIQQGLPPSIPQSAVPPLLGVNPNVITQDQLQNLPRQQIPQEPLQGVPPPPPQGGDLNNQLKK